MIKPFDATQSMLASNVTNSESNNSISLTTKCLCDAPCSQMPKQHLNASGCLRSIRHKVFALIAHLAYVCSRWIEEGTVFTWPFNGGRFAIGFGRRRGCISMCIAVGHRFGGHLFDRSSLSSIAHNHKIIWQPTILAAVRLLAGVV